MARRESRTRAGSAALDVARLFGLGAMGGHRPSFPPGHQRRAGSERPSAWPRHWRLGIRPCPTLLERKFPEKRTRNPHGAPMAAGFGILPRSATATRRAESTSPPRSQMKPATFDAPVRYLNVTRTAFGPPSWDDSARRGTDLGYQLFSP